MPADYWVALVLGGFAIGTLIAPMMLRLPPAWSLLFTVSASIAWSLILRRLWEI